MMDYTQHDSTMQTPMIDKSQQDSTMRAPYDGLESARRYFANLHDR